MADLKKLFRKLALETHPDLTGAGTSRSQDPVPETSGQEKPEADTHADFIELRRDYERALTSFDRIRFGVSLPRHASGTPADFFVALGSLLGRGFPKVPRHEKEKHRYDYARKLMLDALAAMDVSDRHSSSGMFLNFEDSLLQVREIDPQLADRILEWMSRLVEYSSTGLSALCAELGFGLATISRLCGCTPVEVSARNHHDTASPVKPQPSFQNRNPAGAGTARPKQTRSTASRPSSFSQDPQQDRRAHDETGLNLESIPPFLSFLLDKAQQKRAGPTGNTGRTQGSDSDSTL